MNVSVYFCKNVMIEVCFIEKDIEIRKLNEKTNLEKELLQKDYERQVQSIAKKYQKYCFF